jgi:hypothetical protein
VKLENLCRLSWGLLEQLGTDIVYRQILLWPTWEEGSKNPVLGAEFNRKLETRARWWARQGSRCTKQIEIGVIFC